VTERWPEVTEMPPFRNQLKTPEEVELELKRGTLAQCKQELVLWQQRYSSLKSEIREFEQNYEKVLGSRISELEDLEWQLNGLLGKDELGNVQDCGTSEEVQSQFPHKTDLLDEEEPILDLQFKSLKSVYREVAKAVHPDFATDDIERKRRQELMAIANQAYENRDRRTLEKMLADWELPPEPATAPDIAVELVRVIRQIAAVKQDIQAVIRQIEELKDSDIYSFKIRVEEARADGVNLMAEMAATVGMDIAKIKRRLAALRGEEDTQDELKFAQTRVIRFPADRVCGMLFERNSGSVDYRDWKRLGTARGVREVFLDKSIRLDVHGSGGADISFLDRMQPKDFQSLFMYEIDDDALLHIVHLSGLEELYLSNTTISDTGLTRLSSLTGLRRLYIYHTAISDAGLGNLANLRGLKWLTCSGTRITEEGLNWFRQALPGCKAVSFEWRHGR
jgi:Leucine-rich repeat (LRR) protein